MVLYVIKTDKIDSYIIVNVCLYAWVSIHKYMFSLCPLGRPQSSDILVATSIRTDQILNSTVLQKKEPGLFEELVDSIGGMGEMQDVPGISLVPENKELRKGWDISERHRNQPEVSSNGQGWNEIIIVLHYNQ